MGGGGVSYDMYKLFANLPINYLQNIKYFAYFTIKTHWFFLCQDKVIIGNKHFWFYR